MYVCPAIRFFVLRQMELKLGLKVEGEPPKLEPIFEVIRLFHLNLHKSKMAPNSTVFS